MLVCKSSATRKDLHSYIISRFLESLGDLRTKQKGAAGGEVPFPSDFLTAVGKSSPSPHLVMQLAAVEKKNQPCGPFGTTNSPCRNPMTDKNVSPHEGQNKL